MLRHLPSGSRESFWNRRCWRSPRPFYRFLASGVPLASFSSTPAFCAVAALYGMDKGAEIEAMAVLLVTIVLTGDAFFRARRWLG